MVTVDFPVKFELVLHTRGESGGQMGGVEKKEERRKERKERFVKLSKHEQF